MRLKDEFNEQQDYYTMMFSTLSHFDVQEEDAHVSLLNLFGDRPSVTFQSIPSTNVYIHVNSDEADRILVDPAYKLERLKEAEEKLHAMHNAFHEIERQLASERTLLPTPYGRDNYETWYQIELAIAKFDRLFNKVEKFKARKFNDPDNHERREKRMQDRMNKRWTQNYTYFMGGLTEEEQRYRDYFETDFEMDPDDEYLDELRDRERLAEEGQFDPKLYDFIDTGLHDEVHEVYDDIVEDKIFKFKYRQNSDPTGLFRIRQQRMVDRFYERLRTRDPAITQDLGEIYLQDEKYRSLPAMLLEPEKFGDIARDATQPYREYMVKEAIQQYKDYFEDDQEEQRFFEYLDNLSNRDQIRFMECFEDFSVDKHDFPGYVMISKREFNPELSSFSNFMLDLVDFKDRVRPMAEDISRLDVSRQHQPRTITELRQEEQAIMDHLDQFGIEMDVAGATDEEQLSIEEGYSSMEIAAESGAETDAAKPDLEALQDEPSQTEDESANK